jgi:hypothetical protein
LGQKASNGKSIIFETLMTIIPNYINRTENDVFDGRYGSRHKEIATWRGLRILWTNELSKGKQDGDFIKNLADGTGAKYQVMYGVTDIMPIGFKLAVVSNNTLKLDFDNGIKRRLKTMQMNSEFTDKVKNDDLENCLFVKDNKFGEKLETTYKYALMSLIYQYSKAFVEDGYKMKPYPDDWMEETETIVEQADTFCDFFDEFFKEEVGASIGKKKVEQFLKDLNMKNVNFKDQLKRLKIKFKYESQKQVSIEDGGGKGVYHGICLKNPIAVD